MRRERERERAVVLQKLGDVRVITDLAQNLVNQAADPHASNIPAAIAPRAVRYRWPSGSQRPRQHAGTHNSGGGPG